MKPVVLLIGQLETVIRGAAADLDDRAVRWLGAYSREQVDEQLDAEPEIVAAIIGGSLPDRIRGEIVAAIAQRRPDICIYVKDRASGPAAFKEFASRVVDRMVLATADA